MYRILQVLALLGLLAAGPALRAQVTESPVTVQPGHFLLEMDALTLSVDREADFKYTAFGAATTFLTTGLTKNLDLQLGAQFFITEELDASGFTERDSGIGDVFVRTKWRFFESEKTYTQIAVIPYVKLPTNSGGVGNDAVEGGLIVPLGTELLGGFKLDAMAEVDFRRNDADDGYDTYWFASLAVHRMILRRFGLYGEALAGKSSGGQPWEGSLGVGATLHFTEMLWWDFGMYRGISSGASDWSYALRFNYGF